MIRVAPAPSAGLLDDRLALREDGPSSRAWPSRPTRSPVETCLELIRSASLATLAISVARPAPPLRPRALAIEATGDYGRRTVQPTQGGTDFGCYGANLATWLMGDARPTSVTAVTQRLKPEAYPRVADEATIVLEYPGAQAIVQASWNWPFDRKDLEVYGRTGQVLTAGQTGLRVRLEGKKEKTRQTPPLPPPGDDFLRYFVAVARGEIRPSGLSSLENNLVVTEILHTARRSAETERKVNPG